MPPGRIVPFADRLIANVVSSAKVNWFDPRGWRICALTLSYMPHIEVGGIGARVNE